MASSLTTKQQEELMMFLHWLIREALQTISEYEDEQPVNYRTLH
jgi:hypothetical protein